MLHCTSICMISKSVSQIFKIFFQTGNINIFVLRGVFSGRYVQLKSSFSDEKNINSKIWHTVLQRSYRKLMQKRKTPSLTEVGALQSCPYFKTTLIALMRCAFNSRKKMCHIFRKCSFGKKNKANWSIIFFMKNIFILWQWNRDHM